jgi:BirA family biotin operon repressor/biotin-[acetyl-CoA-carboxylase] ligase
VKFSIHYHKELVSTNDRLAEMLRSEDLAEGTIIQAGYQSHGKGHSGNIWQSAADKNLLFSVLLKPSFLSPDRQFDLTKIVCLALQDLLQVHCSGSRIKWPNDMFVGDRKIAGILIENVLQGNFMQHSIAGVGLNVNQSEFDPAITSPTSLSIEKKCHFDIQPLLADLLEYLDKWNELLKSGKKDKIDSKYTENLYRWGIWSDFRAGTEVFQGKILGVLPGGELLLEKGNGEQEKFGFKEIEFLN